MRVAVDHKAKTTRYAWHLWQRRWSYSPAYVYSMDSTPMPPGSGENKAGYLLSVTWVQCAISAVLVASRFYCRVKLTRSLWWDDWCILVPLVSTRAGHTSRDFLTVTVLYRHGVMHYLCVYIFWRHQTRLRSATDADI